MNALLLIAALQVLPGGPVMSGGLADAREPRTGIGFVNTTLLADELIARESQSRPSGDLSEDLQGIVQFGTNFPLLKAGGLVFSIQGGVISRFRLEADDNDALSSDYMVALPINWKNGPFEARLRLMHRSSHLGDELVQNSGIRRLEYDHEEVDGLIARRMGPIRVYAGGTLTLASSFDTDKWGAQAGADGRWDLGNDWGATAGVDWQRHTITNDANRWAFVGGLVLKGAAGSVHLQTVYQRGASTIGEFFLERERFWGFQVVLDRSNVR